MPKLIPDELSDPSGTPVPNLDLFSINDHRDLPDSLGIPEHLIEFVVIPFYIDIYSPVLIGRPGLVSIGSTHLTVDDYLMCHKLHPPFLLKRALLILYSERSSAQVSFAEMSSVFFQAHDHGRIIPLRIRRSPW